MAKRSDFEKEAILYKRYTFTFNFKNNKFINIL